MEPIWKTLRADMGTNAPSFHYWQKDRYPLLLLRTDPLALCDMPMFEKCPIYEKREYKINKTQIQREQQKISTSIIGSRPFYPFRHGRIWRNFCRGNCNGLRFFVFVDWDIEGKFSSTIWWNRALQPKVVGALYRCLFPDWNFTPLPDFLHYSFCIFYVYFFCIWT